jgi:type VI secretion system FHA domain protein
VAGRFAEAPFATAPADEEVGQRYVNAFLRGAGLDPSAGQVDQPEERMHQIGEILRCMVEAMMVLMESRRAIKGEYRLDVTQFQPERNNPLKFEVDAESALRRLLGPPHRGYLIASEAFADAVSELKEHEVAMLAGIQAVWRHAVQLFDPKALEARLGEESGLGGLLASKKARCWDAFVTLYEATVGTTEDEYDRTAARVFADGYDEQIGKQRKRRR